MEVRPLRHTDIPAVRELVEHGGPHVVPRTVSDYWLYATLFSSTCPVALREGGVAGALIGFRSQDDPDDLYVQDVVTHPRHRRAGVFTALLTAVCERARLLGCRRLYLTSEPDNIAAHAVWTRRGFTNLPGDHHVGEIAVRSDFKGPGRDRAVYELGLPGTGW